MRNTKGFFDFTTNSAAVWNVTLLTYLLNQAIQISEGMLLNLILFYLFINYLT